jgi:hypothetical protein
MFDRSFQQTIGSFAHRAWPVALGYAVGMGLPIQAARAAGASAPGAGAQAVDSFYTFPGRPVVTVSSHGNITSFQSGAGVGGAAHFYGEGYVLCHSGVMAYDGGRRESGFGPALGAYCNGNGCSFIRNTDDNVLQLRQTITHLPDEARGVDVTMTVRNLTSAPITKVTLRRFAHIDVDGYGAGTGHADNWWGASQADAVWAWNAPDDHPGPDSMILMRHLARMPANFPYGPKVTDNFADVSCNPFNIVADGPVRGDHAGTLQYNIGTIGAFRSVTVKLEYQRN